MANIILVQPIVGLLDNIKSAPGLPLSLLSSVKLVAKKYKVKLIDQRIDKNWQENLKKEVKKKPLLVATTAMLGPQVEFARKVGETVKKINPNIPVIWGGPHASVLSKQTVKDKTVDIVVMQDGEETFLKLCNALAKKTSLKKVQGICFKQGKKIISNGLARQVDLNKMPDIPYYLVDIKKYLPKRGGVPTLDMESSRGCPFKCKFCYNPIYSRGRWRSLDSDLVLKRVRKIKDKYGIKGVWFIDDEFFINLRRSKKIIQGLHKMKISWTIQGVTAKSILAMDANYLKMLEQSGCEQLNIGAESGCNRILSLVNKGITVKDILTVNKKLKPYNIMPWYYFVVGFPGEQEKDMDKTIKLVLRLLKENPKAKVSGIGCYTPYPGTPFYKESLDLGFKPPKKLLGWKTYSVDQINIPWIKGKLKRKVQTIQFASFFLDKKARDVVSSPIVRMATEIYRPLARFRLKNNFYFFPLDIFIGNKIKNKLAKNRNLLF